MTSNQQQALDTAFAAYNANKTAYENAVIAWNTAKAASSSPGSYGIVLQRRDEMLAAESAMNNAFTAYNTLKDATMAADAAAATAAAAAAAAAFALANPAAAVQIATVNANASTATAQAVAAGSVEELKTKAEAETKLFAQANTKYLIIGGIVIALLITGVVIYLKVRK